jgi:TATA-binding protein-associated factor
MDVELIQRYLQSSSAHQVFLAAVVVQEWAKDVDAQRPGASVSLGSTNGQAQEIANTLVSLVEGPPRAIYREMSALFRQLHSDCIGLVSAFATEGKIPKEKLPRVPSKIDPLGKDSDSFTLEMAQMIVETTFDQLVKLLSKSISAQALPALTKRRYKAMASYGYFVTSKERYDVQVSTAVCGALIALRVMPAKFGPVVKSVMDGVKVRNWESM